MVTLHPPGCQQRVVPLFPESRKYPLASWPRLREKKGLIQMIVTGVTVLLARSELPHADRLGRRLPGVDPGRPRRRCSAPGLRRLARGDWQRRRPGAGRADPRTVRAGEPAGRPPASAGAALPRAAPAAPARRLLGRPPGP